MKIDLELYRREVRVSTRPLIRLSVIDISPDHPQRTILFIHGFGGQATQWNYQCSKFSLSNRVIAIDLRGHGRSDSPGGAYTMKEIQADLEAELDQLGVTGKFVLVGHSFGGAIAAEFAWAHPERVDRLILIATAGEFRLNPLYRLALRMPLPMLQFFTIFARGQLGAAAHVLKAFYTNNLSKWTGWSLFRDLTLPVLIIRGHFDLVFARPLFEEVSRLIPSSVEEDVGASGHMVMLERRDAVNRAIQSFLDEVKPSWRNAQQDTDDQAHAALVHDRPWLAHYDQGVPYTIAIPRIPLHHLLRSAVRRFPKQAALRFEGRIISYRRLNQEANRFANALRSLGVVKGDRVMLLLPNIPQLIIAFFGTLKAGAVAVFSFPMTEPDELSRELQDSGAKVLVTLPQYGKIVHGLHAIVLSQEREETLEPSGASALKHIIFTSPYDYLPVFKRLALVLFRKKEEGAVLETLPAPGVHLLTRLLSSFVHKAPEVDVSPEDLAVIMYTGGTTAAPKGVMLSHLNLVANALQTRAWLPEACEGCERFLSALPYAHSYGLTTALIVPIALGATILLKASFEVKDILKTIQRDHPTIFPGVPGMYVAIKDYPKVRQYGISSINACISGSAPLPVEVQEAFEKLTRGRLVEGYGLTEASPVTHANPLNSLRKVGRIGVPLPSTEACIVDLVKGKEPVPAGQIGELAVRGPQIMLGYWKNPQETRRVLSREGWLLTGDVAQMDEEGYFRIIARKVDLWYPSKPGNPAFPRDVEEVLFEVPQVKEAVVVAIASQPVAFVITRKERPSADALIAFCKRRLPPELVPRLVIFVDDFPRTFIGKVLRRELARRYEESKQGMD